MAMTRRRGERNPLQAVGGACAVFATGKNREESYAKRASFIGRILVHVTITF